MASQASAMAGYYSCAASIILFQQVKRECDMEINLFSRYPRFAGLSGRATASQPFIPQSLTALSQLHRYVIYQRAIRTTLSAGRSIKSGISGQQQAAGMKPESVILPAIWGNRNRWRPRLTKAARVNYQRKMILNNALNTAT